MTTVLDRPAARTTDPITSKMAAATVSNRTSIAMMLLNQFAKKSMTAEQAGEAAELPFGSWRRVSDLLADGHIEVRRNRDSTPMMAMNLSGRKARIFKITEQGRQALRDYKNSK